jgi:hypothetical protein
MNDCPAGIVGATIKEMGFKPAARAFLCREGFAVYKSTSVELTCCSTAIGSGMLGTAAVLPLFGSRADAAFLMSHR